jgi:endopeptidase La
MEIENPTVQAEIMNGFRSLGLFDAERPGKWDRAWMTAEGRDTVLFLEVQLSKARAADQTKRAQELSRMKEQALPFLNRKFFNKNFEILTGGQILQQFVKRASVCDGKPGPADEAGNAYYSRYYHVLDEELGFGDETTQTLIMEGFRKLGLFVPSETAPGLRKNSFWERVNLHPLASDLVQAWQKDLQDGSATNPSQAADGLQYVSPPLQLSKVSPQTAINLVQFTPDVLEKIKEKLRVGSDRVEGTKARTWLKAVFDLPWLNETKDQTDVTVARAKFDQNFYGMDALKERVMEEIAVRNFKGGNKGGIILLWGPPGTGKTACAQVLAEALGRKFVRRSLAGISDAQKITGHDFTYVGAKHGIIIDGMIEAGTKNPVFQIDEIDKVGKGGLHGNPLDALLAALDPQQNDKFTDSYLEVPFDLSKTLFVVTANRIEDFPTPLLSRTEIIRFDAYLPEEKLEIAKRHLIPRQYKEYNIPPERIVFESDAVQHLIDRYTREGGVRKLEQRVKEVFRKAAIVLQKAPQSTEPLTITKGLLDQWLTQPVSTETLDTSQARIGWVNGLYFSEAGGGTLPVQVSVSPGKGKLLLTGSLGKVMQEAAKVALTHIKANVEELGLDEATTKRLRASRLDIHVHYPAGATPKDGPSAGSSTFTALWSALTRTPIPASLAMTGEIDLDGNVTRIGGVLEKVSGAVNQGVTTILLPEENRKDYQDLLSRSASFRKMVSEPVQVKFVSTAEDVIQAIRAIPVSAPPTAP